MTARRRLGRRAPRKPKTRHGKPWPTTSRVKPSRVDREDDAWRAYEACCEMTRGASEVER